jgi:hypothetical protein
LAGIQNAARGKRYTPAVATFEYDLEKNLIEIENDLRNETYELGGYHSFQIDRPKRRLVNAAPFRDRVVHHALMNVIEPLFERQFLFDSYANRNRYNPTNTNNNIGFRCSRLLPEIFNQDAACSRMCRKRCGCEHWRSLSAEMRANIKQPCPLDARRDWDRAILNGSARAGVPLFMMTCEGVLSIADELTAFEAHIKRKGGQYIVCICLSFIAVVSSPCDHRNCSSRAQHSIGDVITREHNIW